MTSTKNVVGGATSPTRIAAFPLKTPKESANGAPVSPLLKTTSVPDAKSPLLVRRQQTKVKTTPSVDRDDPDNRSKLDLRLSPRNGSQIKSNGHQRRESETALKGTDKTDADSKEASQHESVPNLDASGTSAAPKALFAGYLFKKGSTFGAWSKRWFVLNINAATLEYFKTEQSREVKGEIPLRRFEVEAVELASSATGSTANGGGGSGGLLASAPQPEFNIHTPGRAYYLKASTFQERTEWITQLQVLHDRLQKSKQEEQPMVTNRSRKKAEHCARCKLPFGITRRKYACSVCGYVYCLSCLEEQLDGRRICVECVEGNKGDTVHKRGGAANVVNSLSNSSLLLKVVDAREIMAADSNGLSDPYCVIHFEESTYRTETIYKTLSPVWNQEFNIPVQGHGKGVTIALFDEDKYSADDFLGMVYLPLPDFENDKLYDSRFPLKGRPNHKKDKLTPISGDIRLQIVMSTSVLSLFEPVRTAEPHEFAPSMTGDNVKRLSTVFASLEISSWGQTLDDILKYKRPGRSLLFLMAYIVVVLYFPIEWLLPAIPCIALFVMGSNLLGIETKRLTSQLDEKYGPVENPEDAAKSGHTGSTTKSKRRLSIAGKTTIHTTNGSGVPDGGTRSRRNSTELLFESGTGIGAGSISDRLGLSGSAAANASIGLPSGTMSKEAAQTLKDIRKDAREVTIADEDNKDDENLFQRMRRYRETLKSIQNTIGSIADTCERIQSITQWRDRRKSMLVIKFLVFIFIVLATFSPRWLFVIAGFARWIKHLQMLTKGVRESKDEAGNFLARTPTVADMQPTPATIPASLQNG